MSRAKRLLTVLTEAVRQSRPWWRIEASGKWARYLVAAGARRAATPDAMTVVAPSTTNEASSDSSHEPFVVIGPAEQLFSAKTFDELTELPRGGGMRAPDIAERIGPGLRAAADVTAADSPATVSRKVANKLTEVSRRLPTDVRVAALAALALHPEAGHRLMQDRMAWAAGQIGRSHPRAAVRRMNDGFRVMAEYLDTLVNESRPESGWHTYSLHSELRMDLDAPQLIEDRVIVADVDNLEEIGIRLTVPDSNQRSTLAPNASVLDGGEITRIDPISSGYRMFVLRLPASLGIGDRHRYTVRFTTYPGARIPPYYVLTPLRPCEYFHLFVRFAPSFPRKIWRIDGMPPSAVDDFDRRDGELSPDHNGAVSLEFSHLYQGLSYGVRWSV